jgi:ATP-dependent Clp protease ATP-binding subunit ClpA
VFDFIRPEVAAKIVQKNISIIKDNLKKLRNISLEYDDTFVNGFVEVCAKDNLEMGGRGIVNRIETFIKNGLTNFMFKTKKVENCTIKMKMQNKEVIFE